MKRRFHNLYWGVWNDWARRGCVPPPSATGEFPIDGAWFSLKYQRQAQAVPSNQKRKYPDIQRPHRISESTDTAHMLVLRSIFHFLCLEYWQHGPQQTANSPAHPLQCAASCLSFFSSINSSFFAGRYRFHTLGINDCVAWTLLASGICSCLFHKMLQNSIPQSADPGAAIKTVYGWIRRKIVGQLSPFAPWIHQIQNSIRQFPFAPCALTHPCIEWGNFFPLLICQVAGIRLSFFFFHVSILPYVSSFVNTGSYTIKQRKRAGFHYICWYSITRPSYPSIVYSNLFHRSTK